MQLERLSDKKFERLCRANRDRRIEQTGGGEIVFKPGMNGTNGILNLQIAGQLGVWNQIYQRGVGFGSKTLFILPNGAKRSPDLSWLKLERWNALTKQQQEGFAPICPDFVVELLPKTASLEALQNKMLEYIENGAGLGWLIDPLKFKIYVYRPNQAVEILDRPETVSGAPVLPGFVLKLADFWE